MHGGSEKFCLHPGNMKINTKNKEPVYLSKHPCATEVGATDNNTHKKNANHITRTFSYNELVTQCIL